GEIAADLEAGRHLGAVSLRDLEAVADMIVVAVGEHHMRHTADRLLEVPREGRIALEERIDHHRLASDLDAECGMTEPGEPHACLLFGCGLCRTAGLGSARMMPSGRALRHPAAPVPC